MHGRSSTCSYTMLPSWWGGEAPAPRVLCDPSSTRGSTRHLHPAGCVLVPFAHHSHLPHCGRASERRSTEPRQHSVVARRTYVLYKTMMEWQANGPNSAFIACRKELEIAQVPFTSPQSGRCVACGRSRQPYTVVQSPSTTCASDPTPGS